MECYEGSFPVRVSKVHLVRMALMVTGARKDLRVIRYVSPGHDSFITTHYVHVCGVSNWCLNHHQGGPGGPGPPGPPGMDGNPGRVGLPGKDVGGTWSYILIQPYLVVHLSLHREFQELTDLLDNLDHEGYQEKMWVHKINTVDCLFECYTNSTGTTRRHWSQRRYRSTWNEWIQRRNGGLQWIEKFRPQHDPPPPHTHTH